MSGSNAQNVLSTPRALETQNAQQQAYTDPAVQGLLNQVASGKVSLSDAINQSGGLTQDPTQLQQQRQKLWDEDVGSKGGAGIDLFNQTANSELPQLSSPQLQSAFMNELATNPITGGMLASQNVQNNPLLQEGLNAEKGQLQQGQSLLQSGLGNYNQQYGDLTGLQNQGFQLKPEDQTLYGQASGNIARQFGQTGNDLANSLAQRGLSSSGAAGVGFSGLQGNQNEMLAQAQQQIMQQRFQNTLNQIGQQQQFLSQLGAQNNALNAQNNAEAGQLAGTAGNYQNQAYNQGLAGLQAQNQFQNQNIQNEQNQQSQNQNQQNEQYAQQQSSNFGSHLGQIAGGLAAAGSLASGVGALGMAGGAAGAMGASGGGGGGFFQQGAYPGGGMPSGSPSLFSR